MRPVGIKMAKGPVHFYTNFGGQNSPKPCKTVGWRHKSAGKQTGLTKTINMTIVVRSIYKWM